MADTPNAGQNTPGKPAFVHPMALCESSDVASGTRVWAYAHIMRGAKVGMDCNIGDHAFIESGAVLGDRVTVKNNVMVWEGVTVEDDVFLGPGAIFTNDLYPRSPRMHGEPAVNKRYQDKAVWLVATRIRRGASIGAGAVILPGIVVGEYALIGSGAVITKDVIPHALMTGNPAVQKGWVCRCGTRLSVTDGRLTCSVCGKKFHQTDSGLTLDV